MVVEKKVGGKMVKSELLDLGKLEVIIKDKNGQEYAFSKKRFFEVLRKRGLLELLEFTDKLEVEVDNLIIVVTKKS